MVSGRRKRWDLCPSVLDSDPIKNARSVEIVKPMTEDQKASGGMPGYLGARHHTMRTSHRPWAEISSLSYWNLACRIHLPPSTWVHKYEPWFVECSQSFHVLHGRSPGYPPWNNAVRSTRHAKGRRDMPVPVLAVCTLRSSHLEPVLPETKSRPW